MSTKPYELLARFNRDGTVAGVSVRFITTVNGRDFEGDPQPLSGTSDPAFKAFAEQFAAAVVAERDAAVAAKTAAESALATVTAERDAARAEAERLQAELDAIRNPTDAQGFPILTAVQLRLGILGAGISLADIDAAIAAIPDQLQRVRVETYWQYATQFERSHPLLAGMIGFIGLSNEQADAIWRSAGEIR